jgi:hypothetical protein
LESLLECRRTFCAQAVVAMARAMAIEAAMTFGRFLP